MRVIEAEGINVSYGEREILKDISLSIPKGSIFGLIGPSGAGKSTLLRILDLLEIPASGTLRILGEDPLLPGAPLQLRRRMGMLHQKPVLLRRTVHENVALGLKYRHESGNRIDSRVRDALREVGLPDHSLRHAPTLSGGEAQRVSLARALVTDPEILFLDEPTANLDPVSTEKIEEVILHLNREKGMTIILSTHDMLQGQRLATEMGVLLAGRLTQVGSSQDIFQRPASEDIARFVRIENILKGEVRGNREGEVTVDVSGRIFRAVCPLQPGTKVNLLFRPEDVTIDVSGSARSSARNVFPGTVEQVLVSGPVARIVIDCGIHISALAMASSVEDLAITRGKAVQISVKATAIHVLPRSD